MFGVFEGGRSIKTSKYIWKDFSSANFLKCLWNAFSLVSEKLVFISSVTWTHFLPHRKRNYYLLFPGFSPQFPWCFCWPGDRISLRSLLWALNNKVCTGTGDLYVPLKPPDWLPRNLFVFHTDAYFDKIRLHSVVGAVLHGISGVSVKYKLAYVKNREVSLACFFARHFSWADFAICFPCNTLPELFWLIFP